MPSPLKHLVIFGLALPASLAGYHYYAGAFGSEGQAATRSISAAVDRLTRSDEYRLSDLRILEKDLWYVETRYVEPERLNTDAMFQAALDAVERGVPEVMFQREAGGRRLNIAVGSYSTVLIVEPIDSFVALHTQLSRVAAVLEEHLGPDIKLPDVEYALVNGALSTLDPHTILMPPEEAAEMEVDNMGEFGGLGIEIAIDDGHLTIKEPIDGTPAHKAGLQADDQIVRIEDESTINMDLTDAVSRLRGPVGAPVTISVMRKGFEAPRNYTIVRANIRINGVEGKLLTGNIAYLKIKSFNEKADSDIGGLLTSMTAEAGGKLKGLVIDLRGNPGGYLNQAVDISNRFLASGVIVSTVEGGKSGRREVRRASTAGTEPDYPIAVLMNGSSASASEIVAGALRNLDRAVIIGERSFGKGSVQHLYENEDTSRLKLTVAKYLTPGDLSIQSVGIPPDVLLQPSVVRKADEGEASPIISLYWREWVSHEGDLDRHLEKVEHDETPPAYTVRYLRPDLDEEDRRKKNLPDNDWEVQLAREVLVNAKGPRRPEVIASAAGVIERRQREEAARLEAAFRALSIDWTPGTNAADPSLDARLDLGADGVLKAGEEEDIALEVTNHGAAPVYQLSAVVTSDNAWLDHREFYFGKLNPGESRRFVQRVSLPDGYGSEVTPVTITFRDPSHDQLDAETELLHTEGRALPRFKYSVTLHDDGTEGSKGDGDGAPEVGETVVLSVAVTNVGDGPSREAFVRLRNRSGKAIDLKRASGELGAPLTKDGKACTPDTEGCLRAMAPGETITENLSFELRAAPTEGPWKLELTTGDNRAYDYAAVQRGGFYSYFQLTDDLALTPGKKFAPVEREPPRIEITRRPGVEVNAADFVVSGKVTDAHGLRDVMVFHGDKKVFYQGGGEGVSSLPFSVDGLLDPGTSLFVVLARDEAGMSSSAAFSTWYPPAEGAAAKTPEKASR